MREFPHFSMLRKLGTACLFVGSLASTAIAAPEHAITMLGTAKYVAGFENFEYVNANAPKGGTLRLHALGSFETLNP